MAKSKRKSKQKVQEVSPQADDGRQTITVTYSTNSRWTEVVSQFLVELSKAYEYTIDEYSLIPFVWDARQDRLGKLIDTQPASEIISREFMQVAKVAMEMKGQANQMRADYEKVLAALAPTQRETGE